MNEARNETRACQSAVALARELPGTLSSAVVLWSQTGLTTNVQGFTIGAPEGWPLLPWQARRRLRFGRNLAARSAV